MLTAKGESGPGNMRVTLTLITAWLSLQGPPVSFDVQWEDITGREGTSP